MTIPYFKVHPFVLVLFVIVIFSCSPPEEPLEKPAYLEFPKEPSFFENKSALAFKDGKWGTINPYGRWIIPPLYDDKPSDWQDGLSIVKMGQNSSVVNAKHQEIVPFGDYDTIRIYGSDRTIHGQTFIEVSTERGPVFYNKEGTILGTKPMVTSMYTNLSIQSATKEPKSNVHSQLLNNQGEIILKFEDQPFICWIGPFSEGLAPIFLGSYNGGSKNLLDSEIYYGYINEHGELAIPISFDASEIIKRFDDPLQSYEHFSFKGNEALVFLNDHFVSINSQGEKILDYPIKYYSIGLPNNKGIRPADGDFLSKEGSLLAARNGLEWSTGYFSESGNAIQFKASEGKLRLVNAQLDEIQTWYQQDRFYNYWLYSFAPAPDSIFIVKRLTIAESDENNLNYRTEAPEFIGEYQMVKFSGESSPWRDIDGKYFADLGLYLKSDGQFFGVNKLYNQDHQKIFECDSCAISYPGEESSLLQNDWTLQVRYKDKAKEHLTLDGKPFRDLTDYFGVYFVNIEKKTRPSFADDKPNFKLGFNEKEIISSYQKLFPQKNAGSTE